MPLGLAFWIIYLICLIFSIWSRYPGGYVMVGGGLAEFLLIGILGYHAFGSPIHG